ncbi:TetR/AcrR family transcriptional regulator [Rhodococcus sp. ACS1]|uniref:DNA-binding transcriptional regulator, AcrR family n=1 Tax=Rhodococcus jostii TaxID=132919 RepID=A0A1H4ILD3_RHOJO|nr:MULTISPECIES: TetR/AcrR family transcriptional regulator [Rhodococcus]PBC52112.1 TetR/AcrR family transcriptional regulator [Rhodococcus sp. ACS1]SEB34665.1 DNA-binding transcriptional regulator, AcrR family [Rhodococcus jostii]
MARQTGRTAKDSHADEDASADSRTAVERPKQVRLSAAERRKKIIAAASEVFIEQGYSGARTKEIAERAGVTEAFLYRHLASKEEMYEVAIVEPLRSGLAALAYDIQVFYDRYDDRIEFMNAVNERCLRFYTESAAIQAVALYSELGSGRRLYQESLKPILDRIGVLLADRMGWADRGLEPDLVRRAILGSQWAIGLDLILRYRKLDLPEASERLTTLFTSGVREKQRKKTSK